MLGDLATRVVYSRQRGINQPGGAIEHGLGDVGEDRHLGQLVLDQAEVGDGLAKSLALLGVANRFSQSVLPSPDGGGGQLEAPGVEDIEGDDVAAAHFMQQVFRRDLGVVEKNRHGGGTLDAHLLFFRAGREAGGVALDDEAGKLFPAHLGEHDEEVGEAAVGDPHLLPVQAVVLAVRSQVSAGLGGQGVGAGLGFAQAVGGQQLTGGQLGEILFLLRFSAEINNGERANAGLRSEGGSEAAIAGNLFRNDGGGNLVQAQPLVGFGNLSSQQAQLARLAQQRLGQALLVLFEFFRLGQDLVGDKLPGRLTDLALLVAELFRDENLVRGAVFNQKTSSPNCCWGSCGRHGCPS